MIELHINDKTVKLWYIDYELGPFPLIGTQMKIKELQLDKTVLECKCDMAPMISENPYQMYAVVQSRLRPDKIPESEYQEFLLKVAQKRIKKA